MTTPPETVETLTYLKPGVGRIERAGSFICSTIGGAYGFSLADETLGSATHSPAEFLGKGAIVAAGFIVGELVYRGGATAVKKAASRLHS